MLSSAIVLALLSQSTVNSGHYDAAAVHAEAVKRMATATSTQVHNFNLYKSRARACPPGTTNRHGAEAAMQVGDHYFQIATIELDAHGRIVELGYGPGVAYCLFVTIPEERPLTVDEAFDVEALVAFGPLP
jgi:hypothetical protein